MEKTITVSEEVWKKLTLLKVEKNKSTIDDVIKELIKNVN